jgi:23S rRNA pseudouridine2605 synthase
MKCLRTGPRRHACQAVWRGYSLYKRERRAGKCPSLNMTEDQLQRLQKVLAHAGVASRRQSEELIRQGRVSVNGRVVTELGSKVDPVRDDIRVDGQRIQIAASHVYLMLNKPRGVLSTMEDARGRRALGDLVQAPVRLYPVGRLDASSEGLILLTDDGELANLLTHPRFEHEKEYRALVNGRPSEETLAAWRRGIVLDDRLTAPAQVDVIRQEKGSTHLRIVMHEGRKRQIRRIAALLGHPVRELKRVRLGPLELGTLETGQWRYLTAKEIRELGEIKRSLQKMGRRRRTKGSKGWR